MLREKALARLIEKTGKTEGWFDRPIPTGAPGSLDQPTGESRPTAALSDPVDLRSALFTVGEAIKKADDETRGDVLKMLDLFLSSPQSNAGQLPLIVDRLLGELRSNKADDEPKAA
jgi:hypothetical protein